MSLYDRRRPERTSLFVASRCLSRVPYNHSLCALRRLVPGVCASGLVAEAFTRMAVSASEAEKLTELRKRVGCEWPACECCPG